MDRIVSSAIAHRGKVYTGLRHADCIREIVKATGEGIKNYDSTQGFMTETGLFVDRTDGLAIAKAAGQLIRKTPPSDILFSEDLW